MTGPVVIVGGAREAWLLAQRLPDALVRLPSAERTERAWPGSVTLGPVSADWLRKVGARAVIEAAHPCDVDTAKAVQAAARGAAVPSVQLVRARWRAGPKDRWTHLRDMQGLARVVPPSARVLVATGRGLLRGWRGRRARLMIRHISEGGRRGGSLAQVVPVTGPFDVAQEIAALRKDRIDWLVLRNAGGAGGYPKLQAARGLGLRVAMIARPERPSGACVTTVEGALAWLERQR